MTTEKQTPAEVAAEVNRMAIEFADEAWIAARHGEDCRSAMFVDMRERLHAAIDRLAALATAQQASSWAGDPSVQDYASTVAEPLSSEGWAELYRLREAVKGPKGFETWQDAAVHERMLRVKAEAREPSDPVTDACKLSTVVRRRIDAAADIMSRVMAFRDLGDYAHQFARALEGLRGLQANDSTPKEPT